MTQQLLDFDSPLAGLRRSVRANSVGAFGGELTKLEKREQLIVALLRDRGPLTDREIAYALGFSDPNAARPRCTRLLRLKVLREVDAVKCPTTRKTVRRVGLALVPSPIVPHVLQLADIAQQQDVRDQHAQAMDESRHHSFQAPTEN